MKLSLFNKISDFDMQILIFLSHVVVKDLITAKVTQKHYEGLIHPEELLDFLKKFKIELPSLNNQLKNTISSQGLSSLHSYGQSD